MSICIRLETNRHAISVYAFTMNLTVMQPYFFPYLGYFQLLAASDSFVFYDDVQYSKGGWINRNRIKRNGEIRFVTVPLRAAPLGTTIANMLIADDPKWQSRTMNQISSAYHDAPNREAILEVVESTLTVETERIGELAKRSVVEVTKYLDLAVDIVWTSAIYQNDHLKGQARIIDICKKHEVTAYINASGGRHLYDECTFKAEGVRLKFLQPLAIGSNENAALKSNSLSIIDVLMRHSREEVCQFLSGSKDSF